MTTIAYRDGILCTDSACTSSQGILLGTVRKLGRAPDGSLIAAAGKSMACAVVVAWAESGMEGSPNVSDDDFGAILVRPDRTVHHLSGDGSTVQIDAPFHAEGSGYQIALGAMAAGASAEEAVQIACKLDGKSREPVQLIRLGDAP